MQCSNRDRSNPFDPGITAPPPIDLFIEPHNNQAHLSWQVIDVTDYQGFRIYRAVDNDPFEFFKELSPELTFYIDSTLNYYHWYQYRITIMGYSHETPPSNSVRMLAGPGTIWILSRYGYSIREMSYDLLHNNRFIETNYAPVNWDWNSSESEIWLTHAQFRYISKLNLLLGYEDYFFQNDFQRPIDIKWDNNRQLACVLDPTTQKIYAVNNQTVEDTISLQNNHVFKMLLSPQSEIITIDSHAVRIYTDSGNLLSNLAFQPSFTGQDMEIDGNNLYILSVDPLQDKSAVISYDIITTDSNRIEIDGRFNLIHKPGNRDYFWMAENINYESSRAVKLSLDGVRLLELIELKNRIDDIKVNPHDESIIVLQRYDNTIILFDRSGQQVSSNDQIYDPIKVYIQ